MALTPLFEYSDNGRIRKMREDADLPGFTSQLGPALTLGECLILSEGAG